MSEAVISSLCSPWHGRSRRHKLRLFGIAVLAAIILPAAGSFVPSSSGNLLFGGQAEAACKYNLTNEFSRWYGSGAVLTDWCYDGRSVTSRHSTPYADSASDPESGGWRVSFSWAYSECHRYNGITNHNCLTQGQFHFYSYVFGDKYVCVGTRIYGDGNHHRRITDGLCPAAASA